MMLVYFNREWTRMNANQRMMNESNGTQLAICLIYVSSNIFFLKFASIRVHSRFLFLNTIP